MRKLVVLLLCLGFVLHLPAQEKEPVANVNILSKQLDKVNSALSKKLDKINRKLTKKLIKQYPQLQGVNIDSLLDERVYQAQRKASEQAISTDSLEMNGLNMDSFKPAGLDSTLSDSTWQAISELKAELVEGLGVTPAGLDIHQEMGESMAKLGKTEELLKQLQAPNLPELPNLDLPKLPEVPDLKSLINTKDLTDLESQLGELGSLMEAYKGEFKGWDEKLLARATSLEEVRLLQEQKKRMDAYKPLPEGYRQNMEGFQTNDFVKEKLQAKSEEIKRVGGKSLQEKMDDAQAKMSEAKEKFSSLESLDNPPKRKPNPYAGDPFLKRLKFGGNFQINRQDPTSIDMVAQVAYLINARARAGVGLSYRITTQKRITNLDFDDQVYGTRAFFDYTLFRSFYAEALYEWSNTDVLDRNDIAQGRQWVQSAMLGIGNRFSLPKGIQGSFTALYNFFHDEKSPNPSPWVFRVGFEF